VPRCRQTTLKGSQCRNNAIAGGELCGFHLARNKGGNPTLLTDEVTARLVTMLRAGNYIYVATQAAGISRQAFGEWMRRGASGEKADERYRGFREQIELAKAEGEAANVARIAQAGRDDWHAAAWILERSAPQRWARMSQRELEQGPTEPTLEDDPFAEVDELAEARRRRHGS
jgi:hypothetical protein